MTIYGIIWGILFISATVFASFYGGTLSYVLFYTALIVPLVAFVYLLWVYKRFHTSQNLDSHHVVKGAAIPYSFSVANNDIVPYAGISIHFFEDYSYIEDRGNKEECLLPRERTEISTELRCLYKGEYQVGISRITISDFLGLFKITYKLKRPLRIKVYPRVIELDSFALMDDETGRRENHSNANDIPDAFVRDYISGDPIKRIHWKATAREQKLMTRKYTGEPKEEINILFDTGLFSKKEAERMEAEDKMIESVLAVTNFFVSKTITVNVFWQEDGHVRAARISDRREFENFYNMIAELPFGSGVPFTGFVSQILSGTAGVGMCYIFTFPHEDITESLENAAALGYSSKVVLIKKPGDTSPEIEESSILNIHLGEQVENVIR